VVPPADVFTEDYIEANTKVAGVSAHLFVLPEPLVRFAAEQNIAPFNALKKTFTLHPAPSP
jgi:hypothetical protein